ncbi:hypothetical protein D7B24_006767 [Verticillium nonalfalfae]|uniref:Zn(2)-C6 fungal-type domain-containing protein n=1 Tax=Verticillium nonalfalfae TaxID=1051616 RepID=A0A3M9YM92_9PEZI|nr:uncharacterized protein D7B24_006767 [Verticillium nonalfalfae]RNJ60698.1 hypothetical protein D7B24_006767 [Verticillium nonalfalfae]
MQRQPTAGALPLSGSGSALDTPEASGGSPETAEATEARTGRLKFKHYDANTGGFQQAVPGMAVFSLPSRSRSRGAGFPRTRTGCKECKRRRVKCDEATPVCRRCIQGGLLCEGLLHTSAVVPRPKPRQQQQQQRQVEAVVKRMDLQQGVDYVSTLFPGQHEWDSFIAFVQVAEQGGSLPADNVMELVPKVALEDAALREICCSIGALNLRNLQATRAIDQARHRSSLEHYGRALRAVASAGQSNDSFLRTILASLMFVTADILRGDSRTAFAHYAHSRRMMAQHISRRSAETGLDVTRLPLDVLESSAYNMMQRIATHPWAQDAQIEAADTEGRLFLSALPHRHRLQNMPMRFSTTEDAVRWWDVTQHKIMNTIQAWQASQPPQTTAVTGNAGDAGGEETDIWGECLALTDRWRSAFRPLLYSARQGKGTQPSIYLQCLTLESLLREAVAALQAQRRLRPNYHTRPPAATTPVYLEMARETRRLVWQKLDRAADVPVGLESALIRPLAFVVYKTQNAQVVDEVRAILIEFSENLQIATLLLGLMEGKGEGTVLELIDRGWKWHFTCAGCSSGVANMLRGKRQP